MTGRQLVSMLESKDVLYWLQRVYSGYSVGVVDGHRVGTCTEDSTFAKQRLAMLVCKMA